jgi:hypothetical protein
MGKSQLNPKIVEILSTRLHKEKSTVTQQISLLKRVYPGIPSNSVAQIYAHKNNLSVLGKLTPEEKTFLKDIQFQEHPVGKVKKTTVAKSNKLIDSRTIQISKNFKFSDPILSNVKITEAKEMASVYPLLYILENSIRVFIDRIYVANAGIDWWSTMPIKRDIKEKVEKHKMNEERNKWHQRRGANNLDYLDLIELKYFINFNPNYFIPIFFDSQEWFNIFLQEIYMSRCVLCHMNPLEKNNIKGLEVRFSQWNKILAEKF